VGDEQVAIADEATINLPIAAICEGDRDPVEHAR